jgi:hypothetical protein
VKPSSLARRLRLMENGIPASAPLPRGIIFIRSWICNRRSQSSFRYQAWLIAIQINVIMQALTNYQIWYENKQKYKFKWCSHENELNKSITGLHKIRKECNLYIQKNKRTEVFSSMENIQMQIYIENKILAL